MFVQRQRFGNTSSGENSEEDVSEGDILQVKMLVFHLNFIKTNIKLIKIIISKICYVNLDFLFSLSGR